MQMEATGVAIGQHYNIYVLGFADNLNIIGNSIEYKKRAA